MLTAISLCGLCPLVCGYMLCRLSSDINLSILEWSLLSHRIKAGHTAHPA